MLPAVNPVLTMLMSFPLQEGVETVVVSWYYGPNMIQKFPVHASVGLTTASIVAGQGGRISV